MSTFGNFSFGGSNNNNNQSGFGSAATTTPFGASNNNTTGGFGSGTTAFGASQNTNAFGSSNTGGTGLGGFGTSTAPNTNTGTGIFGNTNNTGAFGSANNNSIFGNNNKPASAFGAPATTGFGNTAAGGFGSSSTPGATLGGFGSTNNTAGSFGNQPKSLFGANGSGTTGAFGGGTAFGSAAGLSLNGAVPPCQGTGAVPFAPFSEKEANGGTSQYQTVTFQEPYAKYSLEELRLADYQQGRQFGNGAGAVGAFGATNFGGGFGNNSTGNAFGSTNNANTTGGGLFGNAASSGGTFGANTATTGAFGSPATGGLFGNNKPAGTLFGQAQTTTAATGGGLFGTANNTATTPAFGGFGQANTQSSGGLFGQANQQNKPATGLFGTATNTTTPATGGFSFGGNAANTNQIGAPTQTGGLFGNAGAATTGGFGSNNAAQNNTGTSLFGNSQGNTGGLFGNKTGAFGAAAPAAPATGGGLFGNTAVNTGGGLFGNNNAQPAQGGTGLFGNTANTTTQQTGGLFGTPQAKTGLFGNAGAATGGGLFGNNTTQQAGGLFSNNQQQPATGGFGNTLGGGSSLFGGASNQAKPGLFGTTNATAAPGGSLFGGSGMFGQSQNNQQQQSMGQQDVRHASLLDPNPYNQSTIWSGLPQPNLDNSKPLFTPLTATKKLEDSARKPLPNLKLNHSRYMTPPRRNGFGFSYSTYGTPSSVASTPGGASLSGSASAYGSRGWTGGSFGRSFNRSASVQNLRSQYSSDADDIWKPNAFAPSHRNSGGSIKRLTIDRSIRQDLFNRPPAVPALPAPRPTLNAEVAATAHIEQNDNGKKNLRKSVSFEGDAQGLQLTAESGAVVRTETSDEEDTPAPRVNGASKGKLGAVPEDRESHEVSTKAKKTGPINDPQPGEYWMKPSRRELSKMDRSQLTSYKGFQVGREGCGFVVFESSVDLTTVNLEPSELFEKTVEIQVRSVTVYPDPSVKPPAGRGLNVPSTITIDNSWPRSKGKPVSDTSGPIYEKHMTRLRRIPGTDFVSYDAYTGRWVFKVPHYTRYGLDYDDGDTTMDQSELSLPPHNIDKSADASVMEVDAESDEDDTFEFKKSVPGQFGKQSVIPSDDESDYGSSPQPDQHDSGSEHSAYSEDDMMSEDEKSPRMPGSLPQLENPFLKKPQDTPIKLRVPATPGKLLLDLEGDWAEQLQKTISPRKQNRSVLRDAQSRVALDKAFSPIKPKVASSNDFKTSFDIMHSIFGTGSKKAGKAPEPDFEFPYSKRSKTFHSDDNEMTEVDRLWHASFKPHFTTNGKILYKTSKPGKDKSWNETRILVDESGVVTLGRQQDEKAYDLDSALLSCRFELTDGIPSVIHQPVTFVQLTGQDEKVASIYNLAHVLFDDYEDQFTRGLSGLQQEKYGHRIRKDRLVLYLADQILSQLGADVGAIEQINPVKGALVRLTAHDIPGACELLKKSRNLRLGLLVSQLDGADEPFMSDVKLQLDAWREQKSLSEIDCDIRALYEICAGNVTISRGREGKAVPVEDRAETFTISSRFNLSWLQCFSLGLLYGRSEKTNNEGIARIEHAVRDYQARCDQGEETVKPPENDVVWSLLKLYASKKDKKILAPEFPGALEGLAKPWDHSAPFDVYQAISATIEVPIKTTTADELATSLASELSTKNDLAAAIYALSHVSNPETRKSLIQDLLDRFAATLPGSDTATSDSGIALWHRLTIDLKVPTSWIYMSKARYAASGPTNGSVGGDNIAELRYLVAAEAWDAAHECLTKRVAPSFVIDEEYIGLLEMCNLFGDEPRRRVPSWSAGGDVYCNFALLMSGQIEKSDETTIAGIRKRLVAMGRRSARDADGHSKSVKLGQLNMHELDEHVAIKEMANALARLKSAGAEVGSAKELLEMPVTADVRLEIQTSQGKVPSQSATSGPVSRVRTRKQGLGVRGAATQPAVLDDAMDEDTGEEGDGGGVSNA